MTELEGVSNEEAGSNGTDRAAPTEAEDSDTTLGVAGVDVAVSGDPTDAEAVALSAALVEHLRAEADAGPEESEQRHAVDPWCLAGRFGLRSPHRVPSTCRSGREWKVAGRAATW